MQTRADTAWRVANQEWSNDGIVELLFGLGLFACAGIEALGRTYGKGSSWWLEPLSVLLMYVAVQLIPALKVRIAGPRGGAVTPPGGYGSLRTASIGFVVYLVLAGVSGWLGIGGSAISSKDLTEPFATAFSFFIVGLALAMAVVFFVCSFRYERRDLLWLATGSFLASIWMYWIRAGITGCMLFFMAMGGRVCCNGWIAFDGLPPGQPQIAK